MKIPRCLLPLAAACTLLTTPPARAQVDDLVTNGDFSAGNTGFSSQFAFIAGMSSSPGSFSIKTDPQQFNGALTSFGDHTTGTGTMMVVDGVLGTVWEQTVPVTPDTWYLFTAWVASTHPEQPAVIENSINDLPGTVLTLPTTAGVWQEVAMYWNSRGATSAVLRLRNLNAHTIGAGNDFAVDDISLVAAGAATDPFHAVVLVKGRAVAGAGTPESGVPAGAVWSALGVPAINDTGEMAFKGQYAAPGALKKAGLFLVDVSNRTVVLSSVGDPVPDVTGWTFSSYGDPQIAADGSVLFLATVKETATGRSEKALVHRVTGGGPNGQGLRLVGLTGRPVGQPAAAGLGAHVLKTIGGFEIEAGGLVALRGTLLQDGSTITSANDALALSWSLSAPAENRLLLREGSSPGGGMPVVKSFKTLVSGSGSPGMRRGWCRRTYEATGVGTPRVVLTATATLMDGESRVFSVDLADGTVTVIFETGAAGTPVVGQPGLMKSLGLPALCEVEGVALTRSALSNGSAGLFLSRGTGPAEPLALVGEPAPDAGGAVWASFKDPVFAIDGETLAFSAKLKGNGVTSATDTALYVQVSAGPGGGPHVKLAREGEPAPESGGAVWKTFTSLAVPGGPTGPLLLAKLGGATTTTDDALYGTDTTGALRLLLREGVTVIGGRTVKSFKSLGAVSGSAGVSRSFNRAGEVCALVTFTDQTVAVVVVMVP